MSTDLRLDNNQLSSLPDSFGSITVSRDLRLDNNQLSSLPDSFGSLTVGRNLQLDIDQLMTEENPVHFPNVGGTVS